MTSRDVLANRRQTLSVKPVISPPTGKLGEGNPEFRVITALEFIAFYLNRIEGHLEKIAVAADGTLKE